MTIEFKRLTMELKRIEASKEELELKIMERNEEIENIKKVITTQEARIAELKQTIANKQ